MILVRLFCLMGTIIIIRLIFPSQKKILWVAVIELVIEIFVPLILFCNTGKKRAKLF